MKRKTRLQLILFAVVVAPFALMAKGAAQTSVAADAAAILQPSTLAESKRKWPHLWSDLVINLISMPEIQEGRELLPAKLENLIVSNQPQAGYLLLGLIADPKHSAHRRATNAFVNTWQTMNPLQIHTYFHHAMRLDVMRRESYPQGVKASVGFGYHVDYDWDGWPSQSEPDFPAENFKTRTSHFLDGQLHDVFEYSGPMATTGWIDIRNLESGKHFLNSVIDYEYSYRGEKYVDQVKSPQWSFEIIADKGDELLAPQDSQTDALVRASFRVTETEQIEPSSFNTPLDDLNLSDVDLWKLQVTWEDTNTKEKCGLHVPLWRVTKALPIDLCFEAEIHDVQTGKIFAAGTILVPGGKILSGYIYPNDTEDFVRGRSGFVPVKIVLKPSREHALSAPNITNYYPKSISTGVLRIKIVHENKVQNEQ